MSKCQTPDFVAYNHIPPGININVRRKEECKYTDNIVCIIEKTDNNLTDIIESVIFKVTIVIL